MRNTILIVDDDKLFLAMLVKCFSLEGFTIYTAGNCADAIKLAGRHLPDCFLLDYHLGAGTIAPACRFIRGHDRLRNAPIVVLSGDDEQDVNSYSECQADVFLRKCISCYQILAAVSRQLRRAEAVGGVMRRSDLALDSKALSVSRGDKSAILLSPEQFRFFTVLFERSPQFVSDAELLAYVFTSPGAGTRDALNMLAYRLRVKLGPQLARRIKNRKYQGWVYVQPRRNTMSLSSTGNASRA